MISSNETDMEAATFNQREINKASTRNQTDAANNQNWISSYDTLIRHDCSFWWILFISRSSARRLQVEAPSCYHGDWEWYHPDSSFAWPWLGFRFASRNEVMAPSFKARIEVHHHNSWTRRVSLRSFTILKGCVLERSLRGRVTIKRRGCTITHYNARRGRGLACVRDVQLQVETLQLEI